MRKVLATTVWFVGILLALYVGLWLMFVGGIAQLVDAVQEEPVEGIDVALGVVRVFFASTATVLVFYFVGLVGYLIWDDKPRSRRR